MSQGILSIIVDELASWRGKYPQLRDSIAFSELKIAEEGFFADKEEMEKTK